MKNDVAVITVAPSPAPTVGCGWTGMGDDTSVAASGEGTNVGSGVSVMMPRSIGGCVAVGSSDVLVGTSVAVGGIGVAVFDGAGVSVKDGSGVLLDVAVGGGVAEGAAVSVNVGVAVAMLVGVSVAVGVLVNVALGVRVMVAGSLGVVLGKGVLVAVKVGVGVWVAVGVKVGVGDWVSLGSGVSEGRIATAVGLGDGRAKIVGATVGVATTPTGRLQAMAASPRIIKVRYSRRMGYSLITSLPEMPVLLPVRCHTLCQLLPYAVLLLSARESASLQELCCNCHPAMYSPHSPIPM